MAKKKREDKAQDPRQASPETVAEVKEKLDKGFTPELAAKLVQGITGTKPEIVPALRILCAGTDTLPLADFDDFQEDFKTMDEANEGKLISELYSLGFIQPVSIWKHKGKNLILDGHQRIHALRKMVKEGNVTVDERLPITIVQCKDEQEAARFCMALASNFGKTNGEGIRKFSKKHKIADEWMQQNLAFPDFDLFAMKEKKKKEKKQVSFEASEDGDGKRGECPECGFKGPISKFKKEAQELTD